MYKTTSGERAFVDAFKDVKARSSWVWVALNPIGRFLVRDKRRESQAQRTSCTKTEAEMGGNRPQAQGPRRPRSWKRQKGPYPGDSGGTSALHHLDLRCLVSMTGGG